MTPYTQQFFTQKELGLFARIKNIVESLPDIDLGTKDDGEKIELSCHMLARAIADFFPGLATYEDGYFVDMYEHSWLRLTRGHIIDVYPIAMIGGPVMFECSPLTRAPTRQLYKVSDKYVERFQSEQWFQNAVEKLTKIIRTVI